MTKREPEACMPCRGTGKVISNLGGESERLTCPWCQGAGTRQPGVDAQAAWLEGEAGGEHRVAPADTVA
jgi:DnaJ-class molecular chaperone